MISFENLRKVFPQKIYLDKNDESYLDSASTSLKLQCSIDALKNFYEKEVSNVHRGSHRLSLLATQNYEKSREVVAKFLKAPDPENIIFTKGTTEGINFLAFSLGKNLKEGDEILLTEMEHHSNFLPWKQIAESKKLKLKFIPVDENGNLELSSFDSLLTEKTKIFSIVHISNATGVINPIEELIKKAQKKNIITIVDAAQSVSVFDIDVQKLDCDFLVFSGHKIFSPSGIGVLYGKQNKLNDLAIYQSGGGTIFKVSFEEVDWNSVPQKFEAGTPFIEGAIALASSLSFLKENVDLKEVFRFEKNLIQHTEQELKSVPGLKVWGLLENKANIVSFSVDGFHPSDISALMAKQKVAVRSGHHCCMPLMEKLNIQNGIVRVSFSLYNCEKDIVRLKKSILKAIDVLSC